MKKEDEALAIELRQIAAMADDHEILAPVRAKYPVVLVHGLNVRDFSTNRSPNWGRIPGRLMGAGFDVWFAHQDSWNGVEHNAEQIAESIRSVLRITNAKKVHIVAHSKGGLDVRRAIHKEGIPGHVASLTTTSSPIFGTHVADFLSHIPLIMPYIVVPIFNLYAKHEGDPAPNSYQVMKDLTTKGAKAVLDENPDMDGVIYTSFVFVPERSRIVVPHPSTMILRVFDGKNDGVVPLRATDELHRIVVKVHGNQMITHDEPVDLRKRDVKMELPDGTVFDSAPDLMVGHMLYIDSICD